MDLAQICVDENTCEFLDQYFCPNCGTATGPPHACDFADIFVAELDDKVAERLVEEEVQTTGWTVYRDDGWLVALNGLDDVPIIEESFRTCILILSGKLTLEDQQFNLLSTLMAL